jgi:cytochrome c553
MGKCVFSAVFGAAAMFALVAMPAEAADDIEAKVQVCASCHGQNGVPIDPKTMPIIWGQQESYLFKQLHDYKSGDRDNPIMSPSPKALSSAISAR